MANSLEKFFLAKVKMMPPVEVDLTQQMMTKKSDPPKKVLPPGSSQHALSNAVNKNSDSKISPIKTAQHGQTQESLTHTSGNQGFKRNISVNSLMKSIRLKITPF